MISLILTRILRESGARRVGRGKVASFHFGPWSGRMVLRRGVCSLVRWYRLLGNRIKAERIFTSPLIALANERKTNSNALEYRIEAAVGLEAVDLLRDRLISGTNYRDAVRFCEDELGVQTSLGAMATFHERVCKPFLAARTSQSAALATAISRDFTSGDFDEASRVLLAQTAFELLSDRNADPKERAAMVNALLTARKQDLDTERFRASLRDKLQAGLDALYEEIEGNDKAEAIFAQLREVVAST